MSDISKRFYKSVSAGIPEIDELLIESGKNVFIYELGGNAVFNSSVKVEILFGSDVLLATHGDTVQKTEINIQGDGEKKLTIKLTNDSGSSETIGGYYKGDLQ